MRSSINYFLGAAATVLLVTACNDKGTNIVEPGVRSLNCPAANVPGDPPLAGSVYAGDGGIPYIGGNAFAYTAVGPIASQGVTGLSLTIPAGTLNNGDGTLAYRVSGTASGVGYANFPITFGGLSCTIQQFVRPADATPPSIATLNCGGAVPSGPINVGVAFNGNLTVPYTGANAAIYTAAAPIPSTGLTGLSLTLVADTLDYGPGLLKYNLTGTVPSTGVASFALSFAGKTCSVTIPVN